MKNILFIILFVVLVSHGAWIVFGNQLNWHGRQTDVLTGSVVSLASWSKHRYLFDFKTSRGRLRVSCYGQCPWVKAGEKWRLKLKMTPRDSVREYHQFDYQAYLKHHGYSGTAVVQQSKQNEKTGFDFLADPVDVLRSKMRQWVWYQAGRLSKYNLILALTLGDRSRLSQSDWTVFRNTGTSHLVAISGLHIGLAAAFAFLLIRWLWSLSQYLTEWHAAPRVASIAAWLAAVGYSALAGFAVPTERSLIMISVLVFARLFYFSLNPYVGLSFAAILVVLWDPYSIFAAGTWLSFLAVFFLIYSYQQYQPQNWIIRLLYPQWAVFIGLLPLTISFFGQFSVVAMLANLIAIPLVSFAVVPLLLLALCVLPVAALSHGLFWLANAVLNGLWWYLNALSGWGYSHLVISGAGLISVISGTIGSLILLSPKVGTRRIFGILWFLPCFIKS